MMNRTPPTKLLLITTIPETFTFCAGQVGYMKQRGLDVSVLSSPGDVLHEFADREQVTAHAVEMLRQISPLHDLIAIFRLLRCLQQLRPQIINASTPKAGLLGSISAWLSRIPVRVYYMRGLPMMTATGYKRSLLKWSERVSCLLAQRVFCVSHSLRDVAVSEGLCPANKIQVLLGGSSNGVDATERFNPVTVSAEIRQETRQKYGIPADALVVGFVGRIVRDKGIEELVTAWKRLREEFPRLHLLMVGPFEPQDPISSESKRLIQQDGRIHLTDMVWNTPPLYAVMDVLTLPTYREGFPNTPLEAAAMQVPVIATQVPGCVDAVQDGVTGTLVPAHDAKALAAAIRLYLNDPELRHQHGLAGRDRVLRNFRQEAIWEALYQEYLNLLQTKGLSVSNSIANTQEMML